MRRSKRHGRWGLVSLTAVLCACETGGGDPPPDRTSNSAPMIAGTPATTVAAGSTYSFTPAAGDNDGDSLVFGIDGKPPWATFDTGTGQLAGRPALGDAGVYRGIVVWVSDGGARTALAPFDLTVVAPSAANRAPQIGGTPAASVAVGAVYSFTPVASDPDGTPLTFTVTNLPAWASFDAATGQLGGVPPSSNAGTFSGIVIATTDGQATVSLPAFSIVVTAPPINRPPIISGTALNSVEGGRLYDFTPTASDADGDALTFIVQNRPAWASFDAQSGRLFGTPAATPGTFPNIIITVDDGQSSASLPPFTIDVTAPTANRVPVITGNPETSGLQGAQYTFQPVASDADHDVLTFAIANRPSWAAFDASTGLLQGTPGAAHIGTYSNIVISVSDGKASVSLPAFSIAVASSNTPPVISGTPPATAIAGVQYSFRPTAADPDLGTTLTFSIQNAPAWAAFVPATGELRGTPGAAHLGVSSNIVIRVSDGQDSAALPAFSISVTNAAPQISGTPAPSVVAGDQYSFTPVALDPDGTPLTFKIENRPPWASFDPATGRLQGTPLLVNAGMFAGIEISVTDGVDTVALALFSIVVVVPNSAPTISGQPPVSVLAGTPYSFVPTASDPDGNSLTFGVENAPPWAAINPLTGAFGGTPPAGTAATFSGIVISVTDGTSSAALPPFTITVTKPNTPPTISGTPATNVVAGEQYSFTPFASDPDGTPLTFQIANKPPWASFVAATGQLQGTPPRADAGTFAGIGITVTDGIDTAALAPFSIVVVVPNSPPVISGQPPTSVEAGMPYTFVPTASDPDGNPLTFSVENPPPWAGIDAGTGAFGGTPPAGTAATFSSIVIRVTDGTSSVALPPFAITVTAPTPNRAPTISGTPSTSALQGTEYSFQPIASDADHDALTFEIANRPTWAAFDSTTGLLHGTPAAAHVGSYPNIVISVSDGKASTPLPAFAITVISSNRPPAISGTPATLVQVGSTFSFTPTASDVDAGTTLTFTILNRPSWAQFSGTTGALTGTPAAADAGIHANIVISVSDGQDSAALPAFAITVNRPPVISGVPPTTATVGALYSFAAAASDADGDALTFGIVGAPPWAALSASGVLSGTPGPGDVGTFANISIGVTDGKSPPVVLPSFTITVPQPNRAPTISGAPATLVQVGSTFSFMPTASDADTGTTLTFSIDNRPSWAQFDGATGALTGTPVAANAGIYANIVITVSDGQDSASLAAFAITVNRPPVISGVPPTTATVGALYLFAAAASDADGDALTFGIVGAPPWAALSASGVLSGTPGSGDVGTFTNISIGVTDGKSPPVVLPAFAITVPQPNRAPAISGAPATTVAAGAAYAFTPTATDEDLDTLTFSAANKPAWAVLDGLTGKLSGTPVTADTATYANIVIRVSDGQVTTSLAPFSIAVTNATPSIGGTPAGTATVGTLYSFTPTASDANAGTTLTFSIGQRPAWASFDSGTGRLQGTPSLANVGTFSNIAISVSDGVAAASLAPFSITVSKPPNHPPTISGTPTTTATVGTLYSFTPTASDQDPADTLTFSIQGKPVWAAFDAASGLFQGTPGAGDVGATGGIVISVRDADNASASLAAFSIAVQSNATRSALLTWVPPTQNTDGSPLTDLAGYKIYWGTSPGPYPNSITLSQSGLASYRVENLAPNTYFFVVTAFNSAGVESVFSNFASTTLP